MIHNLIVRAMALSVASALVVPDIAVRSPNIQNTIVDSVPMQTGAPQNYGSHKDVGRQTALSALPFWLDPKNGDPCDQYNAMKGTPVFNPVFWDVPLLTKGFLDGFNAVAIMIGKDSTANGTLDISKIDTTGNKCGQYLQTISGPIKSGCYVMKAGGASCLHYWKD